MRFLAASGKLAGNGKDSESNVEGKDRYYCTYLFLQIATHADEEAAKPPRLRRKRSQLQVSDVDRRDQAQSSYPIARSPWRAPTDKNR